MSDGARAPSLRAPFTIMSLTIRALGVWFLLLIAAVVNGALRQAVLLPTMGEHSGRFVSTLLLSGVIFGIGCLASGFLNLVSSREAWTVGALWLGLTLCFESSRGTLSSVRLGPNYWRITISRKDASGFSYLLRRRSHPLSCIGWAADFSWRDRRGLLAG